MPGRGTLLLAPGPLLLVSGSWLLVSLLLTPYNLEEVRGEFKWPNKVWNVYMGKWETKIQTSKVDTTTNADEKVDTTANADEQVDTTTNADEQVDRTANADEQVDTTANADDLNLRLLKYIISRKYGMMEGRQQCLDKPEEFPKKNLLRNIISRNFGGRLIKNKFADVQEDDHMKTIVEKNKFRDWFRLNKRGIVR